MFKIETGNKMTIINGDTAWFDIHVEGYTFVEGDMVTFTVAESKNYTMTIISKSIILGSDNLDEDGDIKGCFNDDGSCTFFLQPKDTAKRIGTYVYDIQLNLVDGRIDTIVGPSQFTVQQGVTHKKTTKRR